MLLRSITLFRFVGGHRLRMLLSLGVPTCTRRLSVRSRVGVCTLWTKRATFVRIVGRLRSAVLVTTGRYAGTSEHLRRWSEFLARLLQPRDFIHTLECVSFLNVFQAGIVPLPRSRSGFYGYHELLRSVVTLAKFLCERD